MSREIMDQDGDLEALYETAEFRNSQAVAAQALYYLNWLNYYGARLHEGARRKELLEAAEKGFSEFAVGDQKNELIVESLLGRGLCHLELGDTDFAIRDFKLVIDEPNVSAERKAKARLAILDGYARGGRVQDALRYSDELIRTGGGGPGDAALIKFYRLQALFDAEEKAKGPEGDRYRREATALMDQLRGAGKGWADKVDALMLSRIDDPKQWAGKAESPQVKWELARMMLAKNDPLGATPLLEEIVASSDADAKPFQSEAHYWLGVTRFKANEFPAAAGEFDAALAAPTGDWAGEARYLRFKSLESMMAQQPAAAVTERYVASLTDFLANQPSHPMVHEARYRLAEYRQSNGQFVEAIDEYAKVTGDPSFELRARFGTLQSRFELLKTDEDPQARNARLDAIGRDLDRLEAQAKQFKATQKGGDVALQELEAKATLLRAVYLSLRGDSGDAQVATLLADFGTRFPSQTELRPQAVRLQLGALLALNRFAEAEQAVTQHGAALAAENRPEAVEGLATRYAKAGARRKTEGDAAGGEAASRVALALYALMATDGASGDLKQQLAVARLYEQTNDWDGAAKVYRAVLDDDGTSQIALRGLARTEEARGKTADALALWVTYTGKTKPGDLGWYQGQYQQARLLLAGGDKPRSCDILNKLKPAMPGLTDAELREQLNALYAKACG
jgi:tetratricopeptide (TPR) repeat protein